MINKNRFRNVVLILLILSLLATAAYAITGLNIKQEVREFIIDTISPAVTYTNPTAGNNSVLNRNYIEVNLSLIEQNIQNITYELWNITGTVNKTTVTTNITYIKWINLRKSFNSSYWYNATVFDRIGYNNYTEIRILILNTPPSYSSSIPNQILILNRTYIDQFDLDDYFTDNDGDNLTYIFGGNISVALSINSTTNKVTIITPENQSATETIIFTANDSMNTTNSSSVIISTSAVCGDTYCNGNENCNTCQTDCGQCAGAGDAEAPPPPPPPPPVEAPVVVPPETTAEAVTQAVAEAAQAVAQGVRAGVDAVAGLFVEVPESTIKPEEVNITDTPCLPEGLEVNKIKLPGYVEIPKGYQALLDPFEIDENNISKEIELTLTVPKNFLDVHALKCKNNICERVELAETQEVVCEKEEMKEFVREDLVLAVDKLPIQIAEKTVVLSENQRAIESGKFRVEFDHVIEGSAATISQPSKALSQPKNTKLKIIGTPLVLKVSKLGTTLNVTIPYYNDSWIDPNSAAIYVWYNETWFFMGGKLENDAVTGIVEHAENYLIDGEVKLALIGTLCDNCLGSYFSQVHKGVSRDAVIFVHGLGSSPATFDEMIKDIKLTNQPWQVWTFGYPTFRPIDQNSEEFANWIESQQNNFDYIYIAAHSMGGLVTQSAIYYAYQENLKTPGRYKFVDKVRKVMLIATPNKGSPAAESLKNLLKIFAKSDDKIPLFNPESSGVAELIEGKTTPQVPGVKYYVIAGTMPYEINLGITKISSSDLFKEGQLNDGIVSIESAQSVGDILINNKCANYWEIPVTHTELLFNPVTRGIVENVIASEILKDVKGVKDKAVLGNLKYVNLLLKTGQTTYVVIGQRIDPNKNLDITQCSCGNGFCNVGETQESCTSDCANVL